MEMFIEHGENRMECELKIARKYNRPFHILRETEVRLGGFLGLFSKPGVQVEFYFSQPHHKTTAHGYNTTMPISWYATTSDASASRQPAQNSGPALEEEKKKVLEKLKAAAAGGKETSQQILDSLNEIKEKIANGKNDEHPAFVRASELLKSNDFSESYIKGMIERLRKELPLEDLENNDIVQERMLEWIGESISIYKEEENPPKPKVMVLVGPTGVGKTTTISKLAAIYGIAGDERPAIEVRMITIDAFRICAKEQLETIGNIMRIPVTCVVKRQDLKKEIALHSEVTDLFLIDTIGKSPKDASKLGEMKEILDGCGRNAEFHLVISAATKTSDIEDIMRQFEPFNYKSVLLTKMDETDRIGNIISALAEKRKSISYITDGQAMPEDIRRATVVHLLMSLDGFKINRQKIESRFPLGEAEQFKWR